jgi:hypothetical protein
MQSKRVLSKNPKKPTKSKADVDVVLMQDPIVRQGLKLADSDDAPSLKKAVTSRDPDRELNENEMLFVCFHAERNMSPVLAAKHAGFSSPSHAAKKLLASAPVQRAISFVQQQFRESSNITKRRVIEGYIEAIDMARAMSDPKVMISGWAEVAKLCGLNEPAKKEVKFTTDQESLVRQLQQLPDEELLRMAEGAIDADFTEIENDS